MPSATRSKTRIYGSSSLDMAKVKLHKLYPGEVLAWQFAETTPMASVFRLQDPCEYFFERHEAVWIRTREDNWYRGRVSGHPRVGKTRQGKIGLYFPVDFGAKSHVRKYFSPLNGDIKPDIEEIRSILRQGDWLDD